jgi:4-hydroxy-tetrahydrodipicolinate synthase
MSTLDLAGLWVPLVTPFTTDGSLDLRSLDRLTRHVVNEGATGVVALGTTGEPATLDHTERRAVVTRILRVCSELNCPVLVGIGSNSTKETIEAAVDLSSVEAVVGALVVVPYYTRPSPDGVIQHFAAVAAESPVPIVAYNVPYRTGIHISADTMLAIAKLPNVAGLKQAVGGIDIATLEILRSAPPSFRMLAGDDAFITPLIAMGASGAIAAAAHVCTPMFAEMIAAARAGQADTARRIAELLLPVVTAGFAEPNPAVWKAALHAQNVIDSAALRSPMTGATPESLNRILTAIDSTTATYYA